MEEQAQAQAIRSAALAWDEGPDENTPEDEPDEDETWNEDVSKPSDELEDGENAPADDREEDPSALEMLEQAADQVEERDQEQAWAAVAVFRRSGSLPDDAPGILREALDEADRRRTGASLLDLRTTIEVVVSGGEVEATVIPSALDRVYRVGHVSTAMTAGAEFLLLRELRLRTLNALAEELLVEVQVDFFLAPDLPAALLGLLPIRTAMLNRIATPMPLGDKGAKSTRSRLGRLLVETPFGAFPLAMFWPSLAAVGRIWVRSAMANLGTTLGGLQREQDEMIRAWIGQRQKDRAPARPGSFRGEALDCLLALSAKDVTNRREDLEKADAERGGYPRT